MDVKILPMIQDRINHIQKEIKGVVSQSNVTAWEVQFMNDIQLRKLDWGSQKQTAIIDKIEIKVFGAVQSYEDVHGVKK